MAGLDCCEDESGDGGLILVIHLDVLCLQHANLLAHNNSQPVHFLLGFESSKVVHKCSLRPSEQTIDAFSVVIQGIGEVFAKHLRGLLRCWQL